MNNCLNIGRTRLSQPCLLCATSVRGAMLCPACRGDLPKLPAEVCPRCALPSPGAGVCGRCLRHPPAFERTLAAHAYSFPLDALIQHYKYGGGLALAELFAEQMVDHFVGHLTDHLIGPAPDLLLAMPLHPQRLAERGYNQAAELARRLAQRTGIEWQTEACRRIRDTPPQAGLKLLARRRNLRGAFVCTAEVRGRRVALIDDVMTSGSSLNELAKCVKRAGAAEVEAWVVARTL